MSAIVFAATPAVGHLAPLLVAASALAERGHEVYVLTASKFEAAVRKSGAQFVPLLGKADFDPADPSTFPERALLPGGPAQLDFDLRHIFTDVIPDQFESLRRLLASLAQRGAKVDWLFHDNLFLGTWPGLLGADWPRPRQIVGLGVTPLAMSSRDTAPFGLGLPPDTSPAGLERNAALNQQVRGMLAGAQDHLIATLAAAGATQAPPFFFDGTVSMPDRYLQLCIPELEYRRSDAPDHLRFIGPLRAPDRSFEPPAWWHELDDDRPVVLVTQGTVANHDLGELVWPTLEALKDESVLVVVATGRSVADVGPVPDNARVVEYVSFEALLPHVRVMVSNGGYGGVQQALSHGVPVLLAGDTEDKVEVCARSAATGAALNLATRRPTAEALRIGVRALLDDQSYRYQAALLREAYAHHDAVRTIADLLTGTAEDGRS